MYRYSIVPEFMNAKMRKELQEYYNVFVDAKTNFAFKVCNDYQILYGFHDDGIVEFRYKNVMNDTLVCYLPMSAMDTYLRARFLYIQHASVEYAAFDPFPFKANLKEVLERRFNIGR